MNVYPAIPSDALMCLRAPIVPESITKEGAQDTDAASWGVEVNRAWEDCAAKLSWLRDLVATWK